jgi:DNA-binding transcriptional regulator GbsR (MarR family)
VAAVEIDKKGGVKRAYFKSIKDYSSTSLEKIFDAHISTKAKVETDQWTGYKPLMGLYDITQTKSNKGATFFEMNTITHQVKSWLRSTFSWMHEGHIEKYLDEYSYRLNRSNSKETIFDNLINRMIESKPLTYKQISISS